MSCPSPIFEDGELLTECANDCCRGQEYDEGVYENPCIMKNIDEEFTYDNTCLDNWDRECDLKYWKNEHKKLLEIRRNKLLDIVIRPLQIKIKKMLYSPNTRRGRAFIEKSIEWAYE